MRLRVLAVAALALASLVGCSSSGDSGGSDTPTQSIMSTAGAGASGSTGVGSGGSDDGSGSAAAFCAKLEQASGKLGDLGEASSDPSKLADLLQQEIDYFSELKDSAPAELDAPLTDMIKVMTAAKKAASDPSSADTSALQALATKLPKDAQTLANYASAHCTAG